MTGNHWKRASLELRAAGFTPEDIATKNNVVTVAGAYTNAHRCNNRVERISDLLSESLARHGGQGLIVGAPAVSDALTQGSPNAHYSLVSRDIIADSFEIGHRAHHGEAMIVISGCDKTGAAAMMPLARTNDVGLVIYPGTSSPGCVDFEPWASKGNNLTVLDWAEARAAMRANRITAEEFEQVERNVMPGSGTCGAMFTANTMSTITEAMGMMLPRGASHPADYDASSDIHDDVKAQVEATTEALYNLIEKDIRPRDIMNLQAFENAITTAYAMGGSTNMYLHLLAIARDAEVDLTIDHIQAIGERVPLIANLQPHGPYSMVALHDLGGVPIVMKELLDNGLLHGDALTVTGKTVAENLVDVSSLTDLESQDLVLPVSKPIAKPNNHISVLHGNLAPESCVLKLGGKTLDSGEFRGVAKVFENEPDAMTAIQSGSIVPGDVVVVRNVGPKGGPGMPEMVMLTVELQGRGLGKEVALITDGRFSGVSHGVLIGHICPEAADGGPLAAVMNGDTIVIDPANRKLDVVIPDSELQQRMRVVEKKELPATIARGSVLRKYAGQVSSAHYGCVQ
ncbi:MAG: dihydroxy-acid dehydratase [Acidimicrobiales bacterium]|nr:dihydroxy-acid dehydratase [Acidimicrobiales bacterium]HCK74518.1 dihydroxy-acid dehydratase [Acidimicrobiaceae bacterium]|tara:strand:+ start:2943 stop:4652 length:1710 start_codon:yes stop_codon:yes gene_type:complete